MYHRLYSCTLVALFFFLLFLLNQTGNCQDTSQKLDPKFDPTFLDEVVKERRFIGLGESSHGLGELYRVKSEMVKYLHEKHDFTVLAMESGLGDIMLANGDEDIIDPKVLRNRSLFGNFKCEEIMPLFQHLVLSRQSDPLNYVGFDTQLSGGYFDNLLDEILTKYAPDLLDSLTSAFASYYKLIPSSQEGTSANFLYHRNKFTRNIDQIRRLVSQNRERLSNDFGLTEFEITIVSRTIRMLGASVNVGWEDRYSLIVRRDELMFENLVWLADTIFPNQKFIIWGHNGHIQNQTPGGSALKFMGQMIKEKYGDQYYSIGLFVTQGRTYQHWTKDSITFDNSDPSFLEARMKSENGLQFLNLVNPSIIRSNPWLAQSMKALEIENGGEIEFIPIDRFDGLLNVNESDVPTFD